MKIQAINTRSSSILAEQLFDNIKNNQCAEFCVKKNHLIMMVLNSWKWLSSPRTNICVWAIDHSVFSSLLS